jgi:pilus assembly protein FimV
VVATKLDLAKAYVEVSDNENAKTILDEVLVEGDEEQRKQAQILLDQI